MWSFIEHRDQILVKAYIFLSFDKNISNDIGKDISGKNNQKFLDHPKQSTTDVIKITSKRVFQKMAK